MNGRPGESVPAQGVPGGHIELERRIETIRIGVRHRKDPGDIAALADSIDRLGLLQPITISPEGLLVCGWRRLLALKHLGRATTRVWVRSGLSDALSGLLAQQHENTLHKPYSQLEAAALYRELKKVMAEDAARREQASQFSSEYQPRWNGSADSAEPLATPRGDARTQAAQMVTGKASYSRLEQVGALQDIASDPAQPAVVREMVARELAAIDNGAAVDPAFQRVRAALAVAADPANSEDAPRDATELHRRAAEALARAKEQRARRRGKPQNTQPQDGSSTVETPSVRSFALTWADLDGWLSAYDPTVVGTSLNDADWACFERVLREASEFHAAARTARDSAAAQSATA